LTPSSHASADKDDVRCRALARRDRLSARDRHIMSRRICERLLKLPEVLTASSIICFVSFRTEVETAPILRWALRRALLTAVPLVTGARRLEAVAITDLQRDLAPGFCGIPEPVCGTPLDPASLDIAVVPGAAFDFQGRRVGYGGGFFDAFLTRLRPDAARIAVAFETQLVHRVAADGHDLPVDAVVTERRVVRVRAARAAPPPARPPSA
jgi:5-formyltetrahydrofolate cyclo-ligase